MRLAAGVPLALVAVGLAAAGPAPASAGPSMSAPASIPVNRTLTVHARGLIPGRYGLFLVETAFHAPPGGESLECIGRVGPLRSVAGSATLAGRLPHRLPCRFGAGERQRTVTVRPGSFHILVAVPEGPGEFDGTKSFLRRALRVTRAR